MEKINCISSLIPAILAHFEELYLVGSVCLSVLKHATMDVWAVWERAGGRFSPLLLLVLGRWRKCEAKMAAVIFAIWGPLSQLGFVALSCARSQIYLGGISRWAWSERNMTSNWGSWWQTTYLVADSSSPGAAAAAGRDPPRLCVHGEQAAREASHRPRGRDLWLGAPRDALSGPIQLLGAR